MVYKENFVCVIKHNGSILRENDGIVSLPFNSEYSILLKNLNSRRASVNVSIDGKDVLDNKSLIINSNSETELKGFLDGNTAKNKFKFIQKTDQIKNHRGDFIDDGMIRIEFAYEQVFSSYTYYSPVYGASPTIFNSTTFNSFSSSSLVGFDSNSKIKDEGITVKGSEIDQNFNYTSIGTLDHSEVIVIRLRGEKNDGGFITKPINVKTRFICKSCGKKSKSNVKFCSNCGTYLE